MVVFGAKEGVGVVEDLSIENTVGVDEDMGANQGIKAGIFARWKLEYRRSCSGYGKHKAYLLINLCAMCLSSG